MKNVRERTLRRTLVTAIVVIGLAVATEPGLADTSGVTAGLSPGSTFRDCADGCPEMVVVGAGSFEMGPVPGEEEREPTGFGPNTPTRRHLVKIRRGFALGKYDVTRAEFSAFTRDTGYRPAEKTCSGRSAAVGFYVDWRDPGFPQTDHDPVVCVTWNDVKAYLAWLSQKTHHRYRLPSEAEWEYAARAGTSTLRFWGDGRQEACRYANLADLTYSHAKKLNSGDGDFDCEDGYVYTSPVGSFQPNRFGLYDMIGNVYQLTADCFLFNLSGERTPDDGSAWDGAAWFGGDCMVHVTRGGSFNAYSDRARAAFRFNIPDLVSGDDSGFRVARDL